MADNGTSDKSDKREIGRVNPLTVKLYNADASRSIIITHLIQEITIIEDIFKNTMYGFIRIKDAVDLLHGSVRTLEGKIGFPIVGEEFVEIKFTSEYNNVESNIRRFAVYGISSLVYKNNIRVKEYTLELCSPEHLLDSSTVVMKKYEGKNSDSIKALCRDYLNLDDGSGGVSTAGPNEAQSTTQQPTAEENAAAVPPQVTTSQQVIPFSERKKLVRVQPTKGDQIVVVPRLSPIQAAELFARRSISEDEQFQSGTYLFFENSEGYNFCDIEYLIKDGIDRALADEKTYRYYFETALANPQVTQDPDREYKTIMKLSHKHYFDTVEKLKLGVYESDMTVYDFVQQKAQSTRYRFANNEFKDNNNSLTTGGYPDNFTYPENSSTFLKKFISTDDKQIKYSRKYLIAKYSEIQGLTNDELSGESTSGLPKEASGADPGNLAAPVKYDNNVERVLKTIRAKESGGGDPKGNYTIKNYAWPESTASGAYQFTRPTWQKLTRQYGIGTQYSDAYKAPKEIQDAVATRYINQLMTTKGRNGADGDVTKIPLLWYTGNSSGEISSRARQVNRGLAPTAYQADWMRRYNQLG